MSKNKNVKLVLHNIRSAYNVGSIFRTADAAGVGQVYLSGYTPTPIDKFGRERYDIAKVSLGGEKSVPWEYHKTIGPLLTKLKKEENFLVAVEQDENSLDYRKISLKSPTVFILGNEVRGLSKEVLKKCHVIAEIPMKGVKESLNVSVVAGIVLFNTK